MVPKVSINGESDNKGIIKPSGYFEFDNISNSPCHLYIRYLQRRQIEVLRATMRFTSKVCLYHLCIEELNWKAINLGWSDGKSIVT